MHPASKLRADRDEYKTKWLLWSHDLDRVLQAIGLNQTDCRDDQGALDMDKVAAAVLALWRPWPPTAAPEGSRKTQWKLLKTSTHAERSWAEDSVYENGTYANACISCGRNFNGYKLRAVCKVCAADEKPTDEDLNETAKTLSQPQLLAQNLILRAALQGPYGGDKTWFDLYEQERASRLHTEALLASHQR